MSNVAHPRRLSKFPVPPRLNDPAQVESWVEDLSCQFFDLLFASRDATARKRDRVMSRAAAREAIEDAGLAMEQLIFALRAGLVSPPSPSDPTTTIN